MPNATKRMRYEETVPAKVQMTFHIQPQAQDENFEEQKERQFNVVLPNESGKLIDNLSSSRRSSFMLDNHLKQDEIFVIAQADSDEGGNPQLCLKYAEDIYRNLCKDEVYSKTNCIDETLAKIWIYEKSERYYRKNASNTC